MTRDEIIKQISKYFKVSELVCPHTYTKFGEQSWQFLQTELLHTLLVLREDVFDVPIVVNGNGMTQRGLRCNICQLCKDKTVKNQIYLSAHSMGSAIDFDAQGYTASKAREMIKQEANKLPYNVRIENDVTWVHLDVYPQNDKIKFFNA